MTFDEQYFNMGFFDRLSYRNTFVHRLDPRVKLVVTFFFLFAVISFPKYEITALFPFFLYPALLLTLGEIPLPPIVRKIVVVSPFAVFVGIFNPLLDPGRFVLFCGLTISSGWLSFFSIMIKFVLTVGTALLLVATTSFPGVCHALRRLGVPSLFVSQLLFLYRYVFVLMEETMRIVRAREMRSYGRRGRDLTVFVRLAGVVFLRTLERAERVYDAMLSRGFHGDMPTFRRFRMTMSDLGFAACAITAIILFRLYPVTEKLGRFVEEFFS